MDDCIFCKLANGEIPTHTIYEDDLFRVILDADPATKGHALIIPKDHFKDIYDLGEDEAQAIFPLAQKLAIQMKEAFNCDGFNILQNNGEIAGQTVFHFHLHLIPRYVSDGNGDAMKWKSRSYNDVELEEIVNQVKKIQK